MSDDSDFQPPVPVSKKLGSRKKKFITLKGLFNTAIVIMIVHLSLGALIKSKKIENLQNYADLLEGKNKNLSSRLKVFEQWADSDSRLQLSQSRAEMFKTHTETLLEQNERLSRQLKESSANNLELANEIARLYERLDSSNPSSVPGKGNERLAPGQI